MSAVNVEAMEVESNAASFPAIDDPESHTTILEPAQGWQPVNLRELWQYRELLWFTAIRDVQVRYKQSALGIMWAIIQPFFQMVVFSIFFGKMAGIKPDIDVPYPIFAYAALLPWQLFSNTMGQASNSLVTNSNLIKKVYFPRLIIPLSSALSGLVDFAVAFLVLIGMMIFYRIVPGWGVLLLPVFLLFTLMASLAVSLWLSALNVQYRDVRYMVPFLIQLWLFATPVIYPTSKVPEKWQALYSMNPMVGVVEGFRWALLGNASPPMGPMLLSALATFVLLVGGLFYFRRVEDSFADLA